MSFRTVSLPTSRVVAARGEYNEAVTPRAPPRHPPCKHRGPAGVLEPPFPRFLVPC